MMDHDGATVQALDKVSDILWLLPIETTLALIASLPDGFLPQSQISEIQVKTAQTVICKIQIY